MTTTRVKAVAGFVVVLAFLQILFEDVIVFLGATKTVRPAVLNSPFLLILPPLLISALLLVVLVGGALFYTDSLH